MYGIKALLIFLGFMTVASFFFVAAILLWRERLREKASLRDPVLLTLFWLLWFSLVSSSYIRRALFYSQLSHLNASDVSSIQIGHHDFTDQPTIEDIVTALRHYRWFEINHGGWGDSIPMTLRRHSGEPLKIGVALYFREPAAIVGPAYDSASGLATAPAFAPELPQALDRHGVKLPDCDTAYRRPCTPEQLNP